MAKIVKCLQCKHSHYRAGGLFTQSQPMQRCDKYNVTRVRTAYGIKRLPICVQENGGEPKIKETI
jgi:hypothetical protein